jgi:16S rRNA (guanine527-N7)-methyltransferase
VNEDRALNDFLGRVRTAGIGLVSREDRAFLVERHLRPSLDSLPLIPETGKLLDVGSGGGFPGIPIALRRPSLQVVLVDANERKTAFLRRVSRETHLENVQVICSRVELLPPEHEGQYDVITARAVAEFPKIVRWTSGYLNPNGRWLLWKGSNWREEGDPVALNLHIAAASPISGGATLLVLEPKRPVLKQEEMHDR